MLFFNRLWQLLASGCGIYAFVCLLLNDWSGGFVVTLAGICFLVMSRLAHDTDL